MPTPPDRYPASVLHGLLFLSGLSALVYQTVWIKQLTLVVGVEVYAVSIGVSAFFAGLAGGAAVFGRLTDRARSPLLLYAKVEAGIAVLAIVATLGLARAPALFVMLEDRIGMLAWLLPALLIATPALLIGGTLPPLLAYRHPAENRIGGDAGRLYAANTGGAIAGALLTILLLIPIFGIRGSGLFAAAVNLLLAAFAFVLHRRATPPAPAESGPATDSPRGSLGLLLYAVAGAIALGYEILWTQIIVQFLSTRAMAFGVVLATYLSGLVIGSWFYARTADRVTRPWATFGYLVAGAGIAALASFHLLGPWLPALQESAGIAVRDLTGSRMLEMSARFAIAAGFLILPATVLLGAAFPAAARLIVNVSHAGRDVGYTLALNTAFGIAGSLLTGFVMLPALGLAPSLGLLATTAAVIGGIAIAREWNFQIASLRPVAVLLATVLIAALLVPRDRLATLLAETRGGDLVFYEEGPAGTVAVIEQTTPRGRFRRLYIQGVSNSGDVMPSKRYMRLQALLPLLIHPREPKSAMVIAFGTGITAGSLLAYPDLERRLAVELLQPVIAAAPLFEGNFGAGRDPGLEVVIADGRHELMRRDEHFDFITLEPPPPAAAGVVNLYSREFYELAKSRLTDDGLLAQWLPIATQNHEDTQSLVRSMLDVFPYVTLWTTEVHEMMLVGSSEPLSLDYARIRERMDVPSVAEALSEVGIDTTADLLATYITDENGLARYAGDAKAVTDDRPRIEYAPWVRPREILNVLPKLLTLSSPLPLRASAEEQTAVEQSFGELLTFYEAAYRSYGKDAASWGERRRELEASVSDNAYFAWFFDGPIAD